MKRVGFEDGGKRMCEGPGCWRWGWRSGHCLPCAELFLVTSCLWVLLCKISVYKIYMRPIKRPVRPDGGIPGIAVDAEITCNEAPEVACFTFNFKRG